jgi:holo-ACP synthase CitX
MGVGAGKARKVTLQDILTMRERRRERILELFEQWEGHSVIVVTLNIPGPDKGLYYDHLELALLTTSQVLGDSVLHEEVRGNAPGFEGFVVVSGDPMEIKRKVVDLEESHPWGRMWDLDVYRAPDAPIARAEVDAPPRKCLICDAPAKECARSQKHPLPELLETIERMLES